ncbi:MAG TPA: cell division protein ZapA [Candidatus Limnocylindria bacterium]|nr:cell division protein ZapA [Candidatus Limnocylindria bacterium]
MNAPETRLTVIVLGRRYELSGVEDAEHYQRVGDLVNRYAQEAAAVSGRNDPEGAAVFAALRLADEYMRAQAEADRLRSHLEKAQDASASREDPEDAPHGDTEEEGPESQSAEDREQGFIQESVTGNEHLMQSYGPRPHRRASGKSSAISEDGVRRYTRNAFIQEQLTGDMEFMAEFNPSGLIDDEAALLRMSAPGKVLYPEIQESVTGRSDTIEGYDVATGIASSADSAESAGSYYDFIHDSTAGMNDYITSFRDRSVRLRYAAGLVPGKNGNNGHARDGEGEAAGNAPGAGVNAANEAARFGKNLGKNIKLVPAADAVKRISQLD